MFARWQKDDVFWPNSLKVGCTDCCYGNGERLGLPLGKKYVSVQWKTVNQCWWFFFYVNLSTVWLSLYIILYLDQVGSLTKSWKNMRKLISFLKNIFVGIFIVLWSQFLFDNWGWKKGEHFRWYSFPYYIINSSAFVSVISIRLFSLFSCILMSIFLFLLQMEESKGRGRVACHTNVDLYYLKLYIILLKGESSAYFLKNFYVSLQ